MNLERWGFVALAERCTGTSTWASACTPLVVALETEGVIRRAGQGLKLTPSSSGSTAPRDRQEGPTHAHITTNAPRAASRPAQGIQEGGRT